MPPPTKRRKQSESMRLLGQRIKKRQYRARKRWEETYKLMEDYSGGIKNSKGKTRTFEENRMILLALKAALRRRLEGEEDKRKIIWSAIDREVASDLGIGYPM